MSVSAFEDLRKAFDTVDRDSLWRLLRRLRVDEGSVATLEGMHDNQLVQVEVNGLFAGDPFRAKVGVRKVLGAVVQQRRRRVVAPTAPEETSAREHER